MLRWVNFGRRFRLKVGQYCTPIHIVCDSGQKLNLNSTVANAVVSGEVDLIDWMVYHSGQKVDVTGVLFDAVNSGGIEMIKWLFFKSGQEIKISGFVSDICHSL